MSRKAEMQAIRIAIAPNGGNMGRPCHRIPIMKSPARAFLLLLFACLACPAFARPWSMLDQAAPFEAEYLGYREGAVLLRSPSGEERAFPLARFSPEDQVRVFEIEAERGKPFPFPAPTARTGRND